MAKTIEVTEDQVRYFRARRMHLAGPGARDVATAASAILGAQAQQLPPALLALSQRTRGRPTAAEVQDQILGSRRLVRTWGQRDTLHVYDPVAHWATVVAARELWNPGGRRGPMPPASATRKALGRMDASPHNLTRSDLLSIAPKSYLRKVADHTGLGDDDVSRFAAGRLLWCLANEGECCVAEKIGAEQAYATRTSWFSDLEWNLEEALQAASELTRRYLASYGPATPQDVGHFFGARVSAARAWLEVLGPELAPVSCGGRKELVILKRDATELRRKPPTGVTGWPVRLLPLWDCMLMGHADKSWTMPDASEHPRVWRKAAFVAAVVVARGRLVATWSQKPRRRCLDVSVEPFGGWKSSHAAGVRKEARAVAAHLGLEVGDVSIR